jgi:hypothetical protein
MLMQFRQLSRALHRAYRQCSNSALQCRLWVISGQTIPGQNPPLSAVGRYNSISTVYTPRGTYQVNTVGYSPTANAVAQANASAQNEAIISATIERGQQNMVALERGVIKDNTMLPGEWYGGQLHVAPLICLHAMPLNFGGRRTLSSGKTWKQNVY